MKLHINASPEKKTFSNLDTIRVGTDLADSPFKARSKKAGRRGIRTDFMFALVSAVKFVNSKTVVVDQNKFFVSKAAPIVVRSGEPSPHFYELATSEMGRFPVESVDEEGHLEMQIFLNFKYVYPLLLEELMREFPTDLQSVAASIN